MAKKESLWKKTLLLVGIKKDEPEDKNLQWILQIRKNPNGYYNLVDILNKQG